MKKARALRSSPLARNQFSYYRLLSAFMIEANSGPGLCPVSNCWRLPEVTRATTFEVQSLGLSPVAAKLNQ